MDSLMSYNQMKAVYGADDQQVIDIKRHLDHISMSPDSTIAHSNYDLEAFKRLAGTQLTPNAVNNQYCRDLAKQIEHENGFTD